MSNIHCSVCGYYGAPPHYEIECRTRKAARDIGAAAVEMEAQAVEIRAVLLRDGDGKLHTEYAARCREAQESFKEHARIWSLLRDAFGLIDGAECPVDSPEQWKADVRARMAEVLRHKPWADRPEERPEPQAPGVEWLCEHGHKHQTREGAKSCFGSGQTSDVLPKLAAENVRLTNAIREALEAAEEEGIHVHRGTDEPREFVTILRKALE